MNKTKLSLAVLSALLMAGCGSQSSDSASSLSEAPAVSVEAPEVDVEPSTEVSEEASAVVSFTAYLPAVGEARAAFIADTHWIDVDIFQVPAGSLSDAETLCGNEDLWHCLEPQWVSGGSIDNLNPNLTFNFIPSNYLIIARPYQESDSGDVVNQGSIISFAQLSEGAHQIPLYAIEADWTFDTPIDLMLINQANPFDSSAEAVAYDADPFTDEVETIADALELDGDSPLTGILLPSIDRARQFFGTDMWAPLADLDYGAGYLPLFKQNGVDGVEFVDPTQMRYESEQLTDDDGYYAGSENFSNGIGSGAVVYNYADGVVTQDISLGRLYTQSLIVEGQWPDMEENYQSGGLFFLSNRTLEEHLGDESTDVADEYQSSDEWAWPQDPYELQHHAYEFPVIVVDAETGETSMEYDMLYRIPWTGAQQRLYQDINQLTAAAGTTAFPLTEVATGSIITGTLVEYTQIGSNSFMDASPELAAEVQLTDSEFMEVLGLAILDDLLEAMADDAAGDGDSTGEAQAAANARADNCFDVTAQSAWIQQERGLVDDVWQVGVVNWSYDVVMNSETQAYEVIGDDLNGDGTVSYFETGIQYNQSCAYDDTVGEEVCDDLDGDGVGEMYEALPAVSTSDEYFEFCLHPFTMSAATLDIPTADLDVVISSDEQ